MACGILDRILQNYHMAVQRFCTQSHDSAWQSPERSPVSDPDMASLQEASQSTPMEGPLKLRLGAFAVEQEDQIIYVKRIVVTEVEKLRSFSTNLMSEMYQDDLGMSDMVLKYLIKRCDDTVERIST